MTVAVLLALAVGDTAASVWLLRRGRHRQDRNATVTVVGIVLVLCAVSLVVIAVHIGTRPAPRHRPPERLARDVVILVIP